MRTVLITGASGFVGRHLTHALSHENDVEIIGLSSRPWPPIDGGRLLVCDLRDADLTMRVLARYRPDVIYHLAGQAYVPQAFADPAGTLINNAVGQLNLFEGCRKAAIDPVIVAVTSSEIYGAVTESDLPIAEDHPLRPANPYAVSKAAQDLYAAQYHMSYGMKVVRARPFNHIGPGQSDRFVVSSFARQIAEAEAGLADPVLLVGNLEAERDFLDVRDVVQAYRLLAREDLSGRAFNVASGVGRSIRTLLDILLSESTRDIRVETDPQRLRPAEVPRMYGDASLLREATGWTPSHTIEQTVRDVLDDWRARVRRPG